jgi:hypothetical protein
MSRGTLIITAKIGNNTKIKNSSFSGIDILVTGKNKMSDL